MSKTASKRIFVLDRGARRKSAIGVGKYVRLSHLAQETGQSATHLRQLCVEGKIDALKVGSRWFASDKRLHAFLRNVNGNGRTPRRA